MSAISGLIAAFILFVIAGLHALWGMKIYWPAASEASLARSVVGAERITQMPSPAACFVVAAFLLAITVLVLVLQGSLRFAWLPNWITIICGFGAASVFLLRGIVGFLPFWARATPEQPFRSYDFWVYSPLCIALGCVVLMLPLRFLRAGGALTAG